MGYALDGANPNQMTLTGHFNLVLLRPREQDRRQAMVDQVSCPHYDTRYPGCQKLFIRGFLLPLVLSKRRSLCRPSADAAWPSADFARRYHEKGSQLVFRVVSQESSRYFYT